MASDVRIWTGSAWESIKGADGSPGPTVVSADAGNASKLGTDGRLYTPTVTPPTASTVAGAADSAAGAQGVSLAYARADHSHPFPTAANVGAITQTQADARYVNVTGDAITGTLTLNGSNVVTETTGDARYVNVTGDTMTGPLVVSAATTINGGSLTVERDGTAGASQLAINSYSDTQNSALTFRKTRGTKSAQAPLQFGDTVGRINFNTITTTGAAFGAAILEAYVVEAPTAAGVGVTMRFTVQSATGASVSPLLLDKDGGRINGTMTADTVFTPTIRFSEAYSTTGATCDFLSPLQVRSSTPNNVGVLSVLSSAPSGVRDVGAYFDMTASGCETQIGVYIRDPLGGTSTFGCSLYIDGMPDASPNYAVYSSSPAKSCIIGKLGLNWAVPTHQLEINGDSMLRGPLQVVGNITASGTAHAFAANSIPASAIAGMPITTQVITQAAYDALAVKSPTTLYLITG
jgi:hypothetical protein